MINILILGANGQIARAATKLFLERTDARLTLYLRNARRLKLSEPMMWIDSCQRHERLSFPGSYCTCKM